MRTTFTIAGSSSVTILSIIATMVIIDVSISALPASFNSASAAYHHCHHDRHHITHLLLVIPVSQATLVLVIITHHCYHCCQPHSLQPPRALNPIGSEYCGDRLCHAGLSSTELQHGFVMALAGVLGSLSQLGSSRAREASESLRTTHY